MKKITFLIPFFLINQVISSQAVAPYSQDYNSVCAGCDNSAVVENWDQYSYGSTTNTNDDDIWNGWSLNPGLAPGSNAYTLYHDDDVTFNGQGVDNWFVLHLDCSSLSEVYFSYDEFQTFDTSYYVFHGVYTSENYDAASGGAASQPNGTWSLLRQGAASLTPTTQTFTLPNTTTAIAFRFTGDWADNWFIDNISISGESLPDQTVFERLQGNVYRQIESPDDCGSCEEEINYYMFSSDGLRIIGTEYDGTCEQDDFQPFGNGDGEAEIVSNTVNEFEYCLGFLCQTVTFTSNDEDEIQFDFPFFNQTWTAQLYEDEVPCLPSAGLNDYGLENVKLFPNPANDYLNLANNSNKKIGVEIFDIHGKSILNLDNVSNPINISKLKSGIYFAQITSGIEKTTKKLIVN